MELIKPENWIKIIQDLLDVGMTQTEIGESVGLAQSSISDLYRGEKKSTEHANGENLKALHKERCKPKIKIKTTNRKVEQSGSSLSS
jgi:predicted XRE-type DNA-binding protein